MSHEAGLVDYFPSDLKRWVKSEDIGSDGVIECKRYAGVTGIFGSPDGRKYSFRLNDYLNSLC